MSAIDGRVLLVEAERRMTWSPHRLDPSKITDRLPHDGDCGGTLCEACGCCGHCVEDLPRIETHCEGTPRCAALDCGCALW